MKRKHKHPRRVRRDELRIAELEREGRDMLADRECRPGREKALPARPAMTTLQGAR